MPIRISYLLSAIHTPQAGTEGHLLRLIRSLDRTRFAPELILMQRTPWSDAFQDELVPTTVLGFRSFRRPRDWWVVSQLAQHLRTRKTDILEMHSTDAQLVGGVAARWSRVPVALSCRRNLGYQYGPRERILQSIANRYATRFLANADVVARVMGQLEGIDRECFDVIHNGLDLEAFDRSTEQVDERVLEFEQTIAGRRVVSIAANLRPVKNLELFLQAAAKVAAQEEDVVFVVMGSGELESPLRLQAQELAIEGRVLWLGSVPSTAAYLVRSDLACLTSRSEGFSNAIVEYMAAGLPVVATDVGGVGEAVEEGVSGFLVPEEDADSLAERIVHVLRLEEPQRQAMGRRGRARIEDRFSMARQLQAYERLYTDQLQRRNGHRRSGNAG